MREDLQVGWLLSAIVLPTVFEVSLGFMMHTKQQCYSQQNVLVKWLHLDSAASALVAPVGCSTNCQNNASAGRAYDCFLLAYSTAAQLPRMPSLVTSFATSFGCHESGLSTYSYFISHCTCTIMSSLSGQFFRAAVSQTCNVNSFDLPRYATHPTTLSIDVRYTCALIWHLQH